jgi:hypothetical protein
VGSGQKKTLDRRGAAERGWRVDGGTSSGVDAPGKYEETADGHDAEVNVRVRAASNQWEALSGYWDAETAAEVPCAQARGTMRW